MTIDNGCRSYLVIDNDDKEKQQGDDDRRDEGTHHFPPDRLLERPQVITGQVINRQTNDGVNNQRRPETKGRDKYLSEGIYTAVIDNPPETQEAQPHQFATDEVGKDIPYLLLSAKGHGRMILKLPSVFILMMDDGSWGQSSSLRKRQT